MKKLNRTWATLVSAGMAAYGVAVIWEQMLERQRYIRFTPDIGSLLVAVLIGGIGIAALIFELQRQPGDRRPHLLGAAVESFARAWRLFWKTKWLIWVFGSLAAIGVVGGIIQGATQYWMMAARFSNGSSESTGSSGMPVAQQILSGLPLWGRWALSELVPRVSVAGETTILPLVVIALLFWLLPRVARLRGDPACAGKVGFFTACAVLLACISALSSVDSAVTTMRFISFCHQPSTAGAASMLQPSVWHRLDIMAAALIGDAIFCAMLMGGIVGGLVRSRKGDAVSPDSFLRDSVLYFEPLTWIYIVYWALAQLPHTLAIVQAPAAMFWLPVPILALLLLYAPFAPVTRRAGFAGALEHSIKSWRSAFWATVRLVAVGSFVFALSRVPVYSLGFLTKASWLTIPLSPVYALIGVAIRALITLAVWEFYSANVLQPEHALEERG